MQWQARWIWDSGEPCPKNYWLCFRKLFTLPGDLEQAIFNLTADSRYFLYINGVMAGFGPVRSWPWELAYDSFDLIDLFKQGTNTIAVLVNHYGISTSQYVQGRGGLVAQLDLQSKDRGIFSICSDNSWKVRRHESFNRNTGRINVAFPWIEEYDARKFDDNWKNVDYYDADWENAAEIGMVGMEPWLRLVPRDIPAFDYEKTYPGGIESLRSVKPQGQHVFLDFSANFYPQCRDSKDKKQLGYIVSLIHAPQAMTGMVSLLTKKWPEVPERLKINGIEYLYGEGQVAKEIQLQKGANFLIADISGGYQRFEFGLLFDFEDALEFRIPWAGAEYPFLTVGPFDFKPVHNIASMEGVQLNERMPEYIQAWQLKGIQDLEQLRQWTKPVTADHVNNDNIAILARQKRIISEHDLEPSLQNMAKAGPEFSLIEKPSCGDPEIIIDFEKETSAFIEFEIECPAGVTFDFTMFECIHNGKIEYTEGLNNTFRYITKSGRQIYRSYLKRGFRYIMLTIRNMNGPVRIDSICAYRCGYPAAATGWFNCSDRVVNEIGAICERTVRLCMEDTFVDCPAYEQSFWIGDSRVSSLISHYLFGSYDLVKRCLLLAAKSLERSKLPEAQVPTGCDTVLTAWLLLWMIACQEYYEYSGDYRFLSEIYPYLTKTLDNLEQHINNDGLLEIDAWNMLDWAGMDTPADGVVAHQNALLVKAFRDVAYLAGVLAKQDDQRRFQMLAGRLTSAINRFFWDEKEQAYIDSIHHDGRRSETVSMQTNIMVYLCDCATEERRAILAYYLHYPGVRFIKVGSPFMSLFYYEALLKEKPDDAPQRILADIRNKWGEMLAYQATTCWETFLGFYKYTLTRSYCHAWSAGPSYFFGAYLLGVRPLEPGFERILIQPQLAGLQWMEGAVPTPHGRVSVSCKDTGEYLDLQIKIPAGKTAQVILPAKEGREIRLNGAIVNQATIVI